MWDDMQVVLFHISSLEGKVSLAEATREDALAYAKGYKNGQMQLQQRVKELETERRSNAIDGQCALDEANNRIRELESKESGLKHLIEHEFKEITPRLETKLQQAEDRIKELEGAIEKHKITPYVINHRL